MDILTVRHPDRIGLSYVTLREHAFTVTEGEVLQARRLHANRIVERLAEKVLSLTLED